MRPPSTAARAGTFIGGAGLCGFALTALFAFMAAQSGDGELWQMAEHTIVPNLLLVLVGAALVIVDSGSRRRYEPRGDGDE